MKLCSKCGAEKSLQSQGAGKRKKWRCQPCHTLKMRTIYAASRNSATRRYRKRSEVKAHLLDLAAARCGVRSRTSLASKKSEPLATMAFRRWEEVDDVILMSGMTQGELVKILGRTIRAIQRRKHEIRKIQAQYAQT